MKIRHLLAIITLSGSLLLLPQPARAGSFYFHIDLGSHLYSFYPYRYNLWPVYGYHHFSSPYYYTHLHYYFPLISYYHPVYYYPLVPYRTTHLYFSPHYYRHVYAYYRHRPYVHNRYYYDKHRIYGHRRQQYTYYKPAKYKKTYHSTPVYKQRDKKHHYRHEKSHVKKRHYTDRDFRHLRHKDKRENHYGRKYLHRDSGTNKREGKFHRYRKTPADIAGRLIHRNKQPLKQRGHLQQHRDKRYQRDIHGKHKSGRVIRKQPKSSVAGTRPLAGRQRQSAAPSPRSFINERAVTSHKKGVRSFHKDQSFRHKRQDIHSKSRQSDGGFKNHSNRKWQQRGSSASGKSLSRHKGRFSGKRSMLRMRR